jgi:hypothetical protein
MSQKAFHAFLWLLYTIGFHISNYSQNCTSGAIYPTENGCGCAAFCDLSSQGGPNCGSGTTGSCPSGQIYVSIRFFVPVGCSIQSQIYMQNRGGACFSSGADTGDKLRVRGLSNPNKPYVTGASNATISDQQTFNGPDSIVIEGSSNRRDEIISYTNSYFSGNCDASCLVLPIELYSFYVDLDNNLITWTTLSEINTSHFELALSQDGVKFEHLAHIKASMNSFAPKTYKFPLKALKDGIYYVQLTSYDSNGSISYRRIESFNITGCQDQILAKNGQISIKTCQNWNTINIWSLRSELIKEMKLVGNMKAITEVLQLEQGVYLAVLSNGHFQKTIRFIVP